VAGLSDRFSRKLVFLGDLAAFSISSLTGGLATSTVMVFISRAVQ
jgi:MFS family permease